MEVAEIVGVGDADFVEFDVADAVPDPVGLLDADTVRDELAECDDELVPVPQCVDDVVAVVVGDSVSALDAVARDVCDVELVTVDVSDIIVGPAEAEAAFDRTEPEGVFEAAEMVMPEEAVEVSIELAEAERLPIADQDSVPEVHGDDVADPDLTVDLDEDAVEDCVSAHDAVESMVGEDVPVEVGTPEEDPETESVKDGVTEDDGEDVATIVVETLAEVKCDNEKLPLDDTDVLNDGEVVDDEVVTAVDVGATVRVADAELFNEEVDTSTEAVEIIEDADVGVNELVFVGCSDDDELGDKLTVGVAELVAQTEIETVRDGDAQLVAVL